MTPLLIIAAVSLVPVLLAFILGVNSVMLFLSVAVGALLQQNLTDSLSLLLSAFAKGSSSSTAALILLCAPVVLTLVILRKSARPSSLLFQLAPLALTGLTLGYLVLARMSSSFQSSVYGSQFGGSIKQGSDLIIGAAAALNLFVAWGLYRTKHDKKHSKHH